MGSRARTALVTLLTLAATAGAPAAPASAAPASALRTAPRAGGTADLAARVEALTADYRDRTATVTAAADLLARAYTVVGAADDDARAAATDLALARGDLDARVRALYVLGASAGGELALLTAATPEDALWQLDVGGPLAERLLGDTAAVRTEAEGRATAARRHSDAAERTAGQVNDRLNALRAAQEEAAWTLAQARGALRQLQQQDARAAAAAAERLARARRDADTARLPASTPVGATAIPPDVERAYRDAAPTCPGLDWTLLAAVGQVESGHGRDDGPSSAGAIGPMQFMPATFAAYGVDADGDGTADPWSVRDAVFSAARYLCASGAGRGAEGVHAALLTYNHAEWYVDLVLAARTAIRARYAR